MYFVIINNGETTFFHAYQIEERKVVALFADEGDAIKTIDGDYLNCEVQVIKITQEMIHEFSEMFRKCPDWYFGISTPNGILTLKI